MRHLVFAALCFCVVPVQADPIVIDLWPARKIPGPASMVQGSERDQTKPEDKLIAGERIIKLGHVSQPQAHVYLPPSDQANGSAVVICPGGGFHILAWDLEGIEVAEWLNGIGVAAIVLKYRVPTRPQGDELVSAPNATSLTMPKMALGPVMDAQRALSLARANAKKWKLDPSRIGILGFSAGAATGVIAATADGRRAYTAVDDVDGAACTANFAFVIYPGGLADEKTGMLKSHLSVNKNTPPMFFVHAADDHASCLNSSALFTALELAGVSSELHIFESGGHGYGLRRTEQPVTHWPDLAEAWLRRSGFAD